MSETKFTNEEITEINKFRENYARIRADFGGISLSKISIDKQLEELDEYENKLSGDLDKLQKDEKSFLDILNKKYGEGSFNPETGVFTPDKENKSTKTK